MRLIGLRQLNVLQKRIEPALDVAQLFRINLLGTSCLKFFQYGANLVVLQVKVVFGGMGQSVQFGNGVEVAHW